jgi:molybdate transport system substrate-binding protein
VRTFTVITAALFSFATVEAGAQNAAGTPLRVLSSNGIKSALERLVPGAERAIGRRIAIQFSSSAAHKQSIDKGEAFDLAILTPELVEELIRAGTLRAGTRRDLASIELAVGVRAGSPIVDISTPDAIKRRLLAAKSLTWTEGGAASAANLAMLDALGIREQMASRLVVQRVPGVASETVAHGENELVLLPLSEIQGVPGVAVLGLLPREFQRPVVMTAGIAARAQAPDAAASLVAFLTSAASARALEAAGMKPAR